jgi:hypothetical protein
LSRTREKALNDAIASADPGAGFEPFACGYVEFYHSDAPVKIENPASLLYTEIGHPIRL